MKRKTRTITVKDEKFVWWRKVGSVTKVMLSPIDDKTSIITVAFPCGSNDDCIFANSITLKIKDIQSMDGHGAVARQGSHMMKEDEEYCIKVMEPQMAGLLASYLSEHKVFVTRKNIKLNGFDLLSEMGYRVCEVQKGVWW